jgi:hypothetical protein
MTGLRQGSFVPAGIRDKSEPGKGCRRTSSVKLPVTRSLALATSPRWGEVKTRAIGIKTLSKRIRASWARLDLAVWHAFSRRLGVRRGA